MTVYIGLDVSSVVLAAVVIHPLGFSTYAYPLDKDHAVGAFNAFAAMHEVIDSHAKQGEVYVYMEEPFVFRGRPGATIPQAHCQGGLMAAVVQQEVNFEQINNKTVKARIVGNGNASKEDVAVAMKEIWPEMVEHAAMHGKYVQDVIDAGMIALYAQRAVELRAKVARHRGRKG